jgi:hypothetical protein
MSRASGKATVVPYLFGFCDFATGCLETHLASAGILLLAKPADVAVCSGRSANELFSGRNDSCLIFGVQLCVL